MEIHRVARSFHGDSAYPSDVAGAAVVYGAQAPPAPLETRALGAWDGYRAREAADEAQPGRAAVLLDLLRPTPSRRAWRSRRGAEIPGKNGARRPSEPA